ncbi:hypothetical protein PR003_g33118 [Phytophthora rubi]|uniref:Uncharacterized protein n=1 Tax=Phytophthora rubi TaxID=129364 RepID=A0A6A3GAX5_9STRA|nr:hypothetical protein PR001_g32078 [Phytophthora rubi]KAE8955575.1 hypothetical protein PR002_g31748 [Phytophthora rubi]KAE9263559.1 hypothetical protein PR003_g33118 [Phytophthora rubi]
MQIGCTWLHYSVIYWLTQRCLAEGLSPRTTHVKQYRPGSFPSTCTPSQAGSSLAFCHTCTDMVSVIPGLECELMGMAE